MPRRGENIYKRRDGRWEGRYIYEYDSSGKAKYKYVYARTYSDVRVKMINRSTNYKPGSINTTIPDWISWYISSKRLKLKISTIKIYERYSVGYIIPFFGETSLKKLNRDILQAFVNSMSGLAPSTIRSVFSFIKAALKAANKLGYIPPVWTDIELPKPKKNEVEVFTKDEQRLIEAALDVKGSPNDIGILLCLYTGLRIGEVCGLKWEDIDFISKRLIINRTVQRITIEGKSILYELSPKSESSHRKIPLPSFLIRMLKDIKSVSSSPYVLSTCSHMMDPRTYQYRYKVILENAGVKYLNFHTLRHTFSVRALESGFDLKTLSEILGHADAGITLKTYAHSLDEHKRISMERLGDLKR